MCSLAFGIVSALKINDLNSSYVTVTVHCPNYPGCCPEPGVIIITIIKSIYVAPVLTESSCSSFNKKKSI